MDVDERREEGEERGERGKVKKKRSTRL